jgi:hypothetical protein
MMESRSDFAPTFLPKSGEELGPTDNDVICFRDRMDVREKVNG